ncbi:MAG: DUF4157 domain-containing protein, partial [Massilia sp.]
PRHASVGLSVAQSLQRRVGNQGAQALVQQRAAVAVAMRGATKVSSPGEPAELEAEATAKKVMRATSAPSVSSGAGGGIARKAGDPPTVSPNISSSIASSTGSGSPLPAKVINFMEPRFKADFSRVRIHTGQQAAQLSAQLHAQAFTVGNNIFFGKDKFKPDSPEGQELIAHELTHTIQQGAAVQRSAAPEVRNVSTEQVQRDWLPSPLEYAADKANLIPGFRMLTIILGFNPINMGKVDRSAANVLRALLEMLPGGALLTNALNNSGIFEKVGAWIEQRLATLGMAAGTLKRAIDAFIDSLSASDLLNLGGVWERAKRIFTAPIDRIIEFGKTLVADVITFVKDALLLPLAKLAAKLPSWPLLTAVLGKDPISGEAVPRTADTLIGGFLKLIGQEEVWANMQKAGAVPRVWAWFQGALGALLGFVGQLPALAMSALKALTLEDIVLLPRAFVKIGAVFGSFVGQFIDWAGNALWTLLEIVADSISPGAFGYIKKTGAALKSILKNPLPFVGNLVKAAKMGFLNFAGNFLGHLKAGLMDWLLGALPGVYIPKAFTLGEIVKFAFSVLGISWQNIRQKLVKAVGEPAVAAMEAGFDIVKTLVTEGPAAAWDKIKDQLAELQEKIIGGIVDFVIDMVVKKAVPKLVAMFIPGAGFISAIMSIYETVMVFVEKIAKIIQVVKGFIDSIVAIAGGAIGAAASKVESILAGLLSLAINFLAGFIGLGKVADKVMGVIGKVRATIDKALDALIAWIVKMAKKLFAKAFGKDQKDERTPQQKAADLKLGIGEAYALLKDKKLSPKDVRAKLPAIQKKYKMVTLEIVVDAKTPTKETDHIHGVINPDDKSPSVDVGTAEWPVKVGDRIKHPSSSRIEKVVSIDPLVLAQPFITFTQTDKENQPNAKQLLEAFLKDFAAGTVYRTDAKTAAEEREILRGQFPGQEKVVEAIMKRADLRKQLITVGAEQAHHIIPIEILKLSKPIRKLILEGGWNFNGAVNGVALEAGFHGSHDAYTAYALNRIAAWVDTNGTSPVGVIKQQVENTLLPHLRAKIKDAQAAFKKTGITLDEYFKSL